MKIEHYELGEPLGQGGMGVVYRAWDPRLQREVALKVLAPTANPERFRREAAAMAKVAHPHVVRVHDSGVDPRGCPWLVMELIEGRSLAERIDSERTLPVAEATRLARELGEALAEVHEQGLVHRDLKPANVLLREGRALLTDFGLAREDQAERLTQTGQILGTPGYAAPELLVGPSAARAGTPADVYGLGATLYAMLTGAPPISGGTLQEILVATASTRPVEPHALNPSVPPALSRLCLRCLEKDADQRPTLPELLQELGETSEARRRWLGWVPLVGSVLLVSGAAVWTLQVKADPQPSPTQPAPAASSAPSSLALTPSTSNDDLVTALLGMERRILLRDIEGATRIQTRFAARAPESLGARLLRERLAFQRSARKKRKTFVKSIAPIASADTSGVGHYLLGRAYFAKRYYRRASETLGHAIALRPEPLYRLYRIRAATYAKEYAQIEVDLEALEAGVEPWLVPERELVVARYFLRVARFAEGLARVRALIAEHGSTPQRLGLLGRLLEAEGRDLAAARRVLDQSLIGLPGEPNLWAPRVKISLLAGDAVEARSALEKAKQALGKGFQRDEVLVLAALWTELLEGADRAGVGQRVRATKAKGPRAWLFKARVMVALGNVGLARGLLAKARQSGVPRFVHEASQISAELEGR